MRLREFRLSRMVLHSADSVSAGQEASHAAAAKADGSVRRVAIWAGAIAVSLALASCGGSAMETFNLNAPREGLAGRAGAQIVVAPPAATSPFDGDRLVVRAANGSFAYVKDAQWVDTLPRLLQARMIQTFDNTSALRTVARPGDGVVAALALNTEIRRFEIDAGRGEAVVEISAKLVAAVSGRIVAARVFSARAPGSAGQGASASAALDAAGQDALRQIVNWAAGAR